MVKDNSKDFSMSDSEDTENNNDEIEEKETESDADDCDEFELENTFSTSISIKAEKAVTLENNYILHLSCTNESNPKVCAGLSNNACEIFSLANGQINKTMDLNDNLNNIVNIKFGSDNSMLYIGTSNSIKLWDLRDSHTPILEFKDNSDDLEHQKPILHFDMSPNNWLLCAGTELFKGDAFLLFWDIRKHNLLGGYWESHTDDITKVMFHHTDNNKLASGSTDGLVNIFNLKETNEDDALLISLNTESTVEQILWYSTNKKDSICSVTHTTDVQLWDVEQATRYKTFSRMNISKAIKRKSADHCYVANAHVTNSNNIFLLAGSNWHKGECVRAVNVENNEKLTPKFKLNDNKQRIRASWYNKQNEMLVTGGEQGILSVWQKSTNQERKSFLKSPANAKNKIHVKPY